MTREEFISMMGYRDDSPLRNEDSLNIQTGPNGIIDMSNTGIPLIANNRYLPPYSGYHQFEPNSVVTEIPLEKYKSDPRVPKRVGARNNPDGSESTHLMRTETIDGINWVSFPTLFQNPDGSWLDMSDEENWRIPMMEAKKRGELIHFGQDKEAALRFGEGSWKPEEEHFLMREHGGALPKAQSNIETEILNANIEADKWNKEYVQSDNYMSMLKRAGEKDKVINSRIAQAMNFDPYTHITYDINNPSLGQYYNTGYSTSSGETYPPGLMYHPSFGENMLNYNPTLMENHPAYFNPGIATSGWEGLAGHELIGHYGVDKLNRKQRKALKSLINWDALSSFAGDSDEAYDHGKDVYEMRANLGQLRYQLDKAGIYDSKKGLAVTEDGEEGDNPFTEEHLKQILEFNEDGTFKRIKPEFNNEILQFVAPQDLIWMMNNIASTDEIGDDLPDGMMRAQDGKETQGVIKEGDVIDFTKLKTTGDLKRLIPYIYDWENPQFEDWQYAGIGPYNEEGSKDIIAGTYTQPRLYGDEYDYKSTIDWMRDYTQGNYYNTLLDKMRGRAADPRYINWGDENTQKFMQNPFIITDEVGYGTEGKYGQYHKGSRYFGDYRGLGPTIVMGGDDDFMHNYDGITKRGILAHEFGHADKKWLTTDDAIDEEIRSRNKLLQDGTIKKDDHGARPWETRSDLIQFRHDLQDQGIFESTGDFIEFTKEDLEKAKDKKGIGQRLFKHFNDEDIIWFMNNIAQETPAGTSSPFEVVDDFGGSNFISRKGGELPKASDGYSKSDVKDYSDAWGTKKRDTKHILDAFINQGVDLETDTIISSVWPNSELGSQKSDQVTANLVDNIANANIGYTPWSFDPMGNKTQWTGDYPTYFPYGAGFVALPKKYGGQLPKFQKKGEFNWDVVTERSIYPDGEWNWYNPADTWRWLTNESETIPIPPPVEESEESAKSKSYIPLSWDEYKIEKPKGTIEQYRRYIRSPKYNDWRMHSFNPNTNITSKGWANKEYYRGLDEESIGEVQEWLIENGYDVKKDSSWGDETYNALNNYLLDSKLLNKEYTTHPLLTDDLLINQQYIESDGKPKAGSHKGALGLVQAMPGAWNDAIRKGILPENADRTNINHSLLFQRYYMNSLMNAEFVTDAKSDNEKLARALAAYNWGRGNTPRFFKNINYVATNETIKDKDGKVIESGFRNKLDKDGNPILVPKSERRDPNDMKSWMTILDRSKDSTRWTIPQETVDYINLIMFPDQYIKDHGKKAYESRIKSVQKFADYKEEAKKFYSYKLGGGVNRTKQLIKTYKLGGELSGLALKHLEEIGIIPKYKKGGTTHDVNDEDTLLSIATKYNTTEKDINRYNNLIDTEPLYKGQVLDIPEVKVETPLEIKKEKHKLGDYGRFKNMSLETQIKLYSNYVNGDYMMFSEKLGKKLYDKLNRVYYDKARVLNMSVLDYMKSILS